MTRVLGIETSCDETSVAVLDGTSDDFIDISIYDHPRPLEELGRLRERHDRLQRLGEEVEVLLF